jgi:hypothetical protein
MLITTDSAKAAQRPFAGLGMGACSPDGASVGSAIDAAAISGMGAASGIQTAAALALPRVKWAVAAISKDHAPARAHGNGYLASFQTKIKQFSAPQFKAQQFKAQQFSTPQFDAQQFEHVTRAIPAYRSGVGPHPAREPEPV